MTTVRIEDRFHVSEFEGTQIGHVSTRLDDRGRQRARWMSCTLYRKDDGDGYVLHLLNESLVWHLPQGAEHVRNPAELPGADLAPEAVYCGVMPFKPGRGHCPPASVSWSRDLSNRPARAVIELPQVKVTKCHDATAVIRRLSISHRDAAASAATSGPMRDLLEQAMAADPAFLTAAKPVHRL